MRTDIYEDSDEFSRFFWTASLSIFGDNILIVGNKLVRFPDFPSGSGNLTTRKQIQASLFSFSSVLVGCWNELSELKTDASSNHFPFHFVTYMLATPIFTQLLKDAALQRFLDFLIHNYFRYGTTREEEKDRGFRKEH